MGELCCLKLTRNVYKRTILTLSEVNLNHRIVFIDVNGRIVCTEKQHVAESKEPQFLGSWQYIPIISSIRILVGIKVQRLLHLLLT